MSTIEKVHRADDRPLTDPSIVRDGGFGCYSGEWCVRAEFFAKLFIRKLLDPGLDVSRPPNKLPALAQEVLTPVTRNMRGGGTTAPGLVDVMATIKRVLKDSRAFWVSTSLNDECGGYSKKHKYRITLPKGRELRQFRLDPVARRLTRIAERGGSEPSICCDGDSWETSHVFAINSGPLGDEEISFLTRIPSGWISDITPPPPGPPPPAASPPRR